MKTYQVTTIEFQKQPQGINSLESVIAFFHIYEIAKCMLYSLWLQCFYIYKKWLVLLQPQHLASRA